MIQLGPNFCLLSIETKNFHTPRNFSIFLSTYSSYSFWHPCCAGGCSSERIAKYCWFFLSHHHFANCTPNYEYFMAYEPLPYSLHYCWTILQCLFKKENRKLQDQERFDNNFFSCCHLQHPKVYGVHLANKSIKNRLWSIWWEMEQPKSKLELRSIWQKSSWDSTSISRDYQVRTLLA